MTYSLFDQSLSVEHQHWHLFAHYAWPYRVCFLPENHPQQQASDWIERLYPESVVPCLMTLVGHGNMISGIQELDTNRLASSSWDKSIKVWNLVTGECVQTIPSKNSVETIHAF